MRDFTAFVWTGGWPFSSVRLDIVTSQCLDETPLMFYVAAPLRSLPLSFHLFFKYVWFLINLQHGMLSVHLIHRLKPNICPILQCFEMNRWYFKDLSSLF